MATTDATSIHSHPWRNRFRYSLVGLLVVGGCLAFAAYVVVHWVERQILTTDNWVEMVSPLPKQQVVSSALGSYISTQVFAAAPVEETVKEALPPKAAFLAGPLTNQLNTLTTQTSQKLVASDAFQTIWEGANRVAMNRLVSTARGQTPPLQSKVHEKFDINISEASGKLRSALGSVSSAIPALQSTNPQAIDISTDLKARPRQIHQYIQTADTLASVLPSIVIACLLWALAFSRQRRRTTMIFACGIIFTMLVELIAIKWLRQETLNQVHNPANLSAVGYIYDTLVSWLKQMIYIVLGAMVAVIAILASASQTSWAQSFRAYLRIERIRDSRLITMWHSVRDFVQQWQYYLWLAAILLVLVIMASLTTVSRETVANALLLALSLLAILHIMATPPQTRPKVQAKGKG